MNNKVYYGEYSLKHWVTLILKKNIQLPDYQRSFVWDKNKVINLINSIKEKYYVPPITIGAFKQEDNNTINYILDGQQRLTSLLLTYLALFPNKEKFIFKNTKFAEENDDELEEEEENPSTNILEWTFNKLTALGLSKEKIKEKITTEFYSYHNYLEEDLETFFENHFLGFAYLVPETEDKNEQQKYYSTVFRNINIQGKSLLPQESRKSLYFLNEILPPFFEPPFCAQYMIKNAQIDFVRYLSLLSQYHKDKSTTIIARGYKPKMEAYYELFIYSVVSPESNITFCHMSDIVKPEYFKPILETLKLTAQTLFNTRKNFSSIIDADLSFFGLIYYILFQNKSIDTERKNEIQTKLNQSCEEFKGNAKHAKSPAALKYLKERINKSIEIYHSYARD